MTGKSLRAMWMLNHTSARKFEIPMLKKIGITEIFTPKSYPQDPNFRSASVDFSEDENLSIPSYELEVLNAIDWYTGANDRGWEIVNKYFDIVFILIYSESILHEIAQKFNGIVIARAYGLPCHLDYAKLLEMISPDNGVKWVKRLGNRFVFGEAYPHICDREPEFIQSRRIYLPLGLPETSSTTEWNGHCAKILFVCPDIGLNDYNKKIYDNFIDLVDGLPYVIAGPQSVVVDTIDPNILGFVSQQEHANNMRDLRLMFYHSKEPNHIHYHPFEAVRAGMPLIFMAGGLLDRLGGKGLPGRCATLKDAKIKICRILNNDRVFIRQVIKSQMVLLEPMKPDNCESAWLHGFSHIREILANTRAERSERRQARKCKRIAVIIPIKYRGGSLRGAKLLAEALHSGSRQAGEAAEIVLCHLDDPDLYSDDDFADLTAGIKTRAYAWKTIDEAEARRAMIYAGNEGWIPKSTKYLVPNDGICQMYDCDIWVVISDRLPEPLLPIRPHVLMIYDYLQRYVHSCSNEMYQFFLQAARCAQQVLVTTDFTKQDALQYAGINSKSVYKVPMLAPDFASSDLAVEEIGDYFIWTTNAAKHKNHEKSLRALKLYYEEFDGRLDCKITGVDTRDLLSKNSPHLLPLSAIVNESHCLKTRLQWLGELLDFEYCHLLSKACFLWHSGKMDNGTFSVIEAASKNVPALSSDYPAMREIDRQFSLNLSWMDCASPINMARQLKLIEQNHIELRKKLPTTDGLKKQSVKELADDYWRVVRKCL
jgi:glycosyltransferase involved in cell wall biosynthesis